MAYTLGNKCAKNLCKRTHLVQLIIETIVTCFFELGDRQSSHPVKTLLQYYGKSLEALPGVAYPSFRDNRSTLNTKTGYKKNSRKIYMTFTRLSYSRCVVNLVVNNNIHAPS